MSANRHLHQAWNEPKRSYVGSLMRDRIVKWRGQPSIVRIDAPTKPSRARALGYRSKEGFVLSRVKVRRGGSRKRRPVLGRRQKRLGVVRFSQGKSLRKIAEERGSRRFPNLRVLNSYLAWEDGLYKWFEVILMNPRLQSA